MGIRSLRPVSSRGIQRQGPLMHKGIGSSVGRGLADAMLGIAFGKGAMQHVRNIAEVRTGNRLVRKPVNALRAKQVKTVSRARPIRQPMKKQVAKK